MNVTFTRATPEDAAALVNVQIAAFHDDARLYPGVAVGGPPGYDSETVQQRWMREGHYYAIRLEGQIIGGVIVFDMGGGHYHLGSIFIDPAYHNRGIGSQTIAFIERTYPAKKWTLDTPDYATRNHHFYEKFGYVRVGSKPEEDFMLLAYEKHIE